MRNALLSPVSPQLYNFGSCDAWMPNMDVSMAMNSNVNVQDTSFFLESNIFNDVDQQRGGGFVMPFQSIVNFQPGYQSTFPSCKNTLQQSAVLTKKTSVPGVGMDSQAIKMIRKRSFDVASLLPQSGTSDLVENYTACFMSTEWEKNKRRKATSSDDHQIKESIDIQGHKVPVRRSQKLSDKITALQKLVSPYGKTDTASVLQEASLYIKLLQEQIQNLYGALSSSFNSEIDGKLADLRSRGLCLFPLSVTQKVAQEDHFHPNAHLMTTAIARNF